MAISPIKRVIWKKLSWGILAILLNMLLLNLGSVLTSVYAASITSSATPTYIDAKLGFSLQLPIGWVAASHPGMQKTNNEDIVFANPKYIRTNLDIGVMRSSTAIADFTQRGKPTLSIGGYPAFKMDIPAAQQAPLPCLERIMLANKDAVIARWCSPGAAKHAQELGSILATYHDHSTGAQKNQVRAQSFVNPESCAQDIANSGITNPPAYPWGRQDGNPTDSQWTDSYGIGAAVCDNFPPISMTR